MSSRISWVVLVAVAFALSPVASASANYTVAQIFETSSDQAQGFTRQQIDLDEPAFSFTTLVNDDLITVGDATSPGNDEPVTLHMNAEGHGRLVIEFHRIGFPTFADAQVAGAAFLGMRGYDRVLQDHDKSNSAFGHLAGATLREDGSYARMTRLAVVSRGREALFIYATFDHDDYPAYRETLSRFLGAIEMNDQGAPMDALEVVTANGGERFAVPPEWTINETDTDQDGRSDYQLSLQGQEYPNLFVTIRPVALEEARVLGAGMIGQYTAQVEASPHADFAGDAEMNTELDNNGEPRAYSFARGASTVDGTLLISMFRIQTNHDATSSAVLGLNAFDARRGAEGFDNDTQDLIFTGWVAGLSAYTILSKSLLQGIDQIENDLDIRSLGR